VTMDGGTPAIHSEGLGKCFGKKTAHEPYVDRREGILYSGEMLSVTRTFRIVEKAIADMGWPTTFQFPGAMFLACETTEDLEWLKAGAAIAIVEEGGRPGLFLDSANAKASGVTVADAIVKLARKM